VPAEPPARVTGLAGWLPAGWTPFRADTALALAILAVVVLLMLVSPDSWDIGIGGWQPYAWGVVGVVPVAFRRTHPWAAAAAVAVLTMVTALVDNAWSSQGYALWVLAYTFAAYQTWWRAVLASALLWIPCFAALVIAEQQGDFNRPDGEPVLTLTAGLLINAVSMVVIFLIGRTIRARREVAQALKDRAAAAEEGRHAHAEQAVAEERRRIARELHDVVAHHVSVISVMATGARRVLKHDYDAAEQALSTIEQTSRTTLRELRRLLFLLRIEADTESALTPQPGLDGIRTLVEQIREAGLPATLRVTGEECTLDPGVALTAYRIVQEALTNALKHAGGQATAEVRMTFEPEQLSIEIFDTGQGPAMVSTPGHGLLGMRERVAVYGGSLRTGPRPGGGFRVYAKIPVEGSQGKAALRSDPSCDDEAATQPTPGLEAVA
jgi:signal transduction histidine kinase